MSNPVQLPQRGFTLIELAIVVVIAGILAAVAIPIYSGMVEEAKWTEGRTAIGAIRTAMDVYKSKYSNRLPNITDGPVINFQTLIQLEPGSLNLSHFNEGDFEFVDIDTSAGTYKISVTGTAPDSPSGTLTVDQNGVETGP